MRALIDIGSNSIRYMQIDDKGGFGKKRLITTRLAQGLDKNGVLSPSRMAESVSAIAAFAREARDAGGEVAAYATSAVRDAGNRAEFLRLVRDACGVTIDVLSGEEEARLALLGAHALGLADIGGGSSQLVTEGFAQSWPIGCVRAAELKSRAAIEKRCLELFRFPRLFVPVWAGVGGTLTTLACLYKGLTAYEEGAVNGTALTTDAIEALICELEAMGGEGRAAHPLLEKRHDVIVPGAVIACFIMRGMSIPRLMVSDADGMEGYALARFSTR